MKFLIIGGSRFVGPYIVEKLLKKGHEVTIFNRGTHEQKQKGVRLIKGDRNDGFNIDGSFDVVIDTCAYNGKQTETAIKQLKFDFFLHFGTIAAYQKTEIFPLSESSPIGKWPIWDSYNEGKVECEQVLKAGGIKYATIRPTYILGPKNYVKREEFIYVNLKKKSPIAIPGNGQAVVQFVFADEVAEAIVKISEGKHKGAFNIAGDDLITLKGLVEEMARVAGVEPKIEYDLEAEGIGFDERTFPFANENIIIDNAKIKTMGIKFHPLIDGLKKDYNDYYKKII